MSVSKSLGCTDCSLHVLLHVHLCLFAEVSSQIDSVLQSVGSVINLAQGLLRDWRRSRFFYNVITKNIVAGLYIFFEANAIAAGGCSGGRIGGVESMNLIFVSSCLCRVSIF